MRPLNRGWIVLVTDRICEIWPCFQQAVMVASSYTRHWYRSRSKGELSVWFVSQNHQATISKMWYPTMEKISPISMPSGSIHTDKILRNWYITLSHKIVHLATWEGGGGLKPNSQYILWCLKATQLFIIDCVVMNNSIHVCWKLDVSFDFSCRDW